MRCNKFKYIDHKRKLMKEKHIEQVLSKLNFNAVLLFLLNVTN